MRQPWQVTLYVEADDAAGAIFAARQLFTQSAEMDVTATPPGAEVRPAYNRRKSDRDRRAIQADKVPDLTQEYIFLPGDPDRRRCVQIVQVGMMSRRCTLARNHQGEHVA